MISSLPFADVFSAFVSCQIFLSANFLSGALLLGFFFFKFVFFPFSSCAGM